MTAPYMHDGSMSTLRAVLEHYNRGGHAHEGLDAAIRPLGRGEREIEGLLAFLHGLTGDNLEELVRDARSERVGNPGDGAVPD